LSALLSLSAYPRGIPVKELSSESCFLSWNCVQFSIDHKKQAQTSFFYAQRFEKFDIASNSNIQYNKSQL
jgi:hypothetical protein